MNMTMSSILGNFLNFGCLDTYFSSLADISTISAYNISSVLEQYNLLSDIGPEQVLKITQSIP